MSATILCIDDYKEGLEVRKLLLEKKGFRVLTTCSASLGIELALREKVDLVILDYRMPDMMGDEVARILKGRRPDLKILMLTGYMLEQEEAPDVDSIVTKGQMSVKQLVDEINRLLHGQPVYRRDRTG